MPPSWVSASPPGWKWAPSDGLSDKPRQPCPGREGTGCVKPLLSRAYGYAPLVLLLAALGWGGNTIASRMAVGEVSPMMLIFLRWVIVAGLILVLHGREMRRVWPVMRPRLRWIAVMGGIGLTMFNALFYIAGHHTTAINLGIIQNVMPAMILIGSFLFFGSRIRWLQGLGLCLTFSGAVVVVSQGRLADLLLLQFNYGDLIMLTACFFYSGYTLGLRGRPEVDSLVMMGYFSVPALLATIPLLAIEHFTWGITPPTTTGWLIILFVALIPSFLAQVLFMRGVDLIGPGPAGLYTNSVPIFSSILAILILGEDFRLHHVVAMTLVFGGIYLFGKLRD